MHNSSLLARTHTHAHSHTNNNKRMKFTATKLNKKESKHQKNVSRSNRNLSAFLGTL